MKKPLIFISIVGLFLAFLFILFPKALTVSAATDSPPVSGVESPPGTTTTSTTASNTATSPATVASTPSTTQTTTAQTPTTNSTAASTTTANTATSTSPTTTTDRVVRKDIPLTGVNGPDAKVTDMNGQPIQPSDNLYTWLNFNVNYNWSIADGVVIEAGDMSSFQLPEGLVASGDLSFPIYNSSGKEIGVATIKNGESTGTITFNDALESTDTNRTGTLSLVAKGTNTGDNNVGQNWMFNKNGWVAGYDQNNIPDELTWNIAFNPNEHNLKNVVITDFLGPNQEYIPGSLTAIGGSYGPNGFVSNGQQLNPTVTTDGNKVIISFPDYVTTAVDIYYRVKVTDTSESGITTWTNHATMGSSEGDYTIDSSTSWGGSGTGNGQQSVGSVTLKKTDATGKQGLAGAEYKLVDSKGNVIISNGTTDENGVLAIKNLPYGTYTLTEVKAPDGYQLNTEPISFTIPNDGVIDLNLSQADTSELGAVILKKLDPDSKATIAGATFNLLDSAGNVIQEGLVTDGNGEIAIDNLPAGDYSFVETQPAAGYELNETPINFTVVAGQTTPVELEKFNVATTVTPNTGNILLTKVDSKTGNFLPGTVYNLLDSEGNILQSNLITDDKGQISIPNLPAGTYSLVETKAPEGYEINIAPIIFTVKEGQTDSLTAKNNETPTNPGEPGGPEAPGEPEEPGTTEPPTTGPEEPTNPGTKPPVTGPEEPTNPGTKPPVTGPGEPSEPENPGTTEPPTTGPEEPTNPGTKPPVTGPEEPSEPENPGTVVPPVYPEIPGTDDNNDEEVPSPENPGAITPAPSPDEVLPPINPGNVGGGSSSGVVGLPGSNSTASGNGYNKGTFPQTGNESGLFMMISGLFIALFVILKHLIKKISY